MVLNTYQKKIIKTLPNTEVIGLCNCKVIQDTMVDNISQKTRTFNLHSFYNDVSTFIISDNVEYKIDGNGKVINCLMHCDSFYVESLYCNNIADGEIIMDVIFDGNQVHWNSDSIKYTEQSLPKYVTNKLYESNPSTCLCYVAKDKGNYDLNSSIYVDIDFKYNADNFNVDKIMENSPYICDVMINDKLIFTGSNKVKISRRVYNAPGGISLNARIPYSFDMPNIFRPNIPLHLKIIKRNKDVSHNGAYINVMLEKSTFYGWLIPNVFSLIDVKVGDITDSRPIIYDEWGDTESQLYMIPDNVTDDVEFTLHFKDDVNSNDVDIYGMAMTIYRKNVSSDTRPSPEVSSDNVNDQKYCIFIPVTVDDKCLKFTLKNQTLRKLALVEYTNSRLLISIGYITRSGGTFTTTKPNLPIE